MEITTAASLLAAFYRLTGVAPDDPALTQNGEAQDEVGYLFLTTGIREAQRWLLKMGYTGWRSRSAALVFVGSDDTTGGRYVAVPDDFLRTFGNKRLSAITEANGNRWGRQVGDEDLSLRGDFYYVQGEQLWITRGANPPTTCYLDYHYRHPELADGVTLDFPIEARYLIAAEAANAAKEENWLPGFTDLESKIAQALTQWREKARGIVRTTKGPREFRKPYRIANRY
jgi:hypothetical protein